MATFLVEDEVGYHATRVGFPSLGGCMGCVLQTNNGLFGFHITPGNARKSAAFNTFVTGHSSYGPAVKLWGTCKWENRYFAGYTEKGKRDFGTPFIQWTTEMMEIAKALNYRGPIGGINMNAEGLSIPNNHAAAYCEYVRNPSTGKVKIGMSMMSEVDSTKDVEMDGPVRFIAGGKLRDRHQKSAPTSVTSALSDGFRHTSGGKGVYDFIY